MRRGMLGGPHHGLQKKLLMLLFMGHVSGTAASSSVWEWGWSRSTERRRAETVSKMEPVDRQLKMCPMSGLPLMGTSEFVTEANMSWVSSYLQRKRFVMPLPRSLSHEKIQVYTVSFSIMWVTCDVMNYCGCTSSNWASTSQERYLRLPGTFSSLFALVFTISLHLFPVNVT